MKRDGCKPETLMNPKTKKCKKLSKPPNKHMDFLTFKEYMLKEVAKLYSHVEIKDKIFPLPWHKFEGGREAWLIDRYKRFYEDRG